MSYLIQRLLFVFAVSLITTKGFAFYESETSRGDQTYRISSKAGIQEECVTLKTYPGMPLSSGDQEDGKYLCGLDFTKEALCPKLKSTNPGIEIFDLPDGVSKEQFESIQCQKVNRDGDRVAKFKQSLTCSYTPSILAYSQLSRILGGINRVPVAVIRTMDATSHKAYSLLGAQYASKIYRPMEQIRVAWAKTWPDIYAHPPLNPMIFTKDLTEIYGALSLDTHDDPKYEQINGPVVGHYEQRYEIFAQTPIYQKLKDIRPIGATLAADFKTSTQTLVQMKDVSDMLVMDYLLNQQDRIGNIAYQNIWYWLENGLVHKKKAKVKHKLLDPDQLQIMRTRGAILVKEMLLRDNDCGVSKTNMLKAKGMLQPLAHISLETYQHLLWFERNLGQDAIQNHILTEWLFTPRDLVSVTTNVKTLVQLLKTKCAAGTLNLDLNLEQHLNGTNKLSVPEVCELPAGFAP